MIELPVVSAQPSPTTAVPQSGSGADGDRIKRLPPWFRKRLAYDGSFAETDKLLNELGLETVCRSAKCPNINECWSRKAATFMIMGPQCTRNCGYCAVPPGKPAKLEADEPQRVAEAAAKLGLRHVVVTSVDRDDLPDFGSGHFVRTIRELKARMPDAIIEVLVPDFQGRHAFIASVLDAGPHIFNHNTETVPRLYRKARPGGKYPRLLDILRFAKEHAPHIHTKTGLMVGLGETDDELFEVMRDLRKVNVDILTIGQYLRPTPDHLEVDRYVTPERFAEYEKVGREMGFLSVSAGPFIRSSYNAAAVFEAMGKAAVEHPG
jgi:lipoic acid synthetase